MALMSSSSAVQGAGSAIWSQLQQQQLQRAADQAEARARALQAQAREAENVAVRAQENARSLKVQSGQAEGEARNAALGLARSNAARSLNSSGNAHEVTSTVPASRSVATEQGIQPVVNAEGQTTGTLISVLA